MIYQPFKAWWCCLNPREANSIVGVLALFVTNPLYIDRLVFDALMTVTGENSSIKMLELFMQLYSLEYATIPDGEGGEKEVVIATDTFWVFMLAFSFTDDYVCTSPCKIQAFSA